LPNSKRLLTWRGCEPSPPEPFTETYYCTRCCDYFALAIAPRSQERAPPTIVLAAVTVGAAPTAIICPQCRSEYPQYGVLNDKVSKEPLSASELFVGMFPPDSPPAPEMTLNGLSVERLILLVSGPLPPVNAFEVLAIFAVKKFTTAMNGTPVWGGAVPIHMLAVPAISDDTERLTAILETSVYHRPLGTRSFGSTPTVEAESGTRFMLCYVLSAYQVRS